MKPHIEQTIADLTERRDFLNHTIDYLSAMAASEPVIDQVYAAADKNGHRGLGQTPLRIVKPRATKPGKKERALLPSVGNQLKACSGLIEPFSKLQFQIHAGLSKVSAASTIVRWTKKGWLKKVGYGQYQRTSDFPSGAQPLQAAVKPKPRGELATAVLDEASRADLQEKLADALKQRDHARNQGRDTMVEIFQKAINKLEEMLEARA